MHIDMDCFFASVGTRDNPQLATRPVAITHSQGLTENSTAEIASCNYAARSFGISNGMILRKAVQLCPNLVCLPYEFDKYDASSKDLYRILMSVADDIQVVSCDEAFIDVSSQVSSEADALELAQRIRRNVLEKTGCSASIGIGPNLLLTRLATKRAKPNGVFYLHHSEAIPHLNPLSLDSLPGVGSILSRKLSAQGIKTCHDLRNISLPALQKVCGPKTGSMLYNFCRGVDDRVLENKGRQSLGCEINWGIRFQTSAQVESFFRELCDYVGKKLAKSKLLGHQITIKAKKRLYKGEPPKLLGCGRCQDYSKSLALTKLTQDPKTLFKEAYTAFRSLGVPVVDIRGVGVHISKLVPNSAHQSHSIWGALGTAPVISPSKAKGPLDKYLSPTKSRNASDIFNDFRPSDSAQKVDSEVFNMLPPDIQAELRASSYIQFATPLSKLKRTIRNDMSIDQGRVVDLTDSQSHDKVERIEAPDGVDQDVFMELPSSIRKELLEARPTKRQQRDSPEQLASPTAPGPPLKRIKATPLPRKKTINWRPGRFDPSPSQIDQNVLQELPDFIREELLENIERQNNQKRKLLDLGLKIRGASFSSPAASSSSAPRPAPVALYTKASFRGHSDLPEVLIHIDSALKEEENTEHVLEDLRLFVLDLIQSYELDTAWCILRFLLKKFRGAGEESERFCQEIYNEVDDAVFCNFGYRLKRV